jgi:hypothetical protein
MISRTMVAIVEGVVLLSAIARMLHRLLVFS